MSIKKYIYLFVITFFIFSTFNSCKKSEKEIEHNYFKNAISKIRVDNTFKWIVILPGLGCDGCIQEGEAFMKKNIEKKQVLFILTNISSLKILEQKIGIRLKEHPNIYIDRNNKFCLPTQNSIYPCIIQINNFEIAFHEFQNPTNGMALSKLSHKLHKI
jgi:hypothetical protein